MSRKRVLFGLVVAALLLASFASASSDRSKPSLTLLSWSPITVHGVHFAGRERVRVTFHGKTSTPALTVRTTSTGTFTVSAPSGFSVDRCTTALVITAVGPHGDNALLKRPPRECAPASTP